MFHVKITASDVMQSVFFVKKDSSSTQKQRSVNKNKTSMFQSQHKMELQHDVLMGCFLMKKEDVWSVLAVKHASKQKTTAQVATLTST